MSPRTPAEMQSWLRERDLILVKNLELQQHRGELDNVQKSVLAIREALIPKLQAISGAPVDGAMFLSRLAAQTKHVVLEQAERRQRQVTLQADVQRYLRTIESLEFRLKSASNTLSAPEKCIWQR